MMMGFLRRLVFTGIGFALLWLAGLVAFLLVIPNRSSESPQPTDAIVVLTGGPDRIAHGIALLVDGKGKRLFISGVNAKATPEEVLAQSLATVPEAFVPLIDIGKRATSTIGNAQETAVWLQIHDAHSLRLVTANYHMPRSLLEFRAVLPNSIAIIPDPVTPDPIGWLHWWQAEKTRKLILSEYHKTLAAMLRHLLLRWERNA